MLSTQRCRIGIRHDLVVIAMHHQNRHGDLLQVFGLGERDDAVVSFISPSNPDPMPSQVSRWSLVSGRASRDGFVVQNAHHLASPADLPTWHPHRRVAGDGFPQGADR